MCDDDLGVCVCGPAAENHGKTWRKKGEHKGSWLSETTQCPPRRTNVLTYFNKRKSTERSLGKIQKTFFFSVKLHVPSAQVLR